MSDQIDLQHARSLELERRRRSKRTALYLGALGLITVGLVVLTPMLLTTLVGGVEPAQNPTEAIAAALPFILAVLILGGSALVLSVVFMGREVRQLGRDRRRTAQVLGETVPGLSEKLRPPQAPPAPFGALGLVLLLGLAWLLLALMAPGQTLIRRLWPGAPDWAGVVILLVVFWAAVPLGQRFWARLRSQPPDPGASLVRDVTSSLVRALGALVPAAILLSLLSRGAEVARSVAGNPATFGVFVLVGGLALVMLVPMVAALLPSYWVFAAVRRADYDGALRRVAFLQRFQPRSASSLFMQGTVLDYAGRHAEADRILDESLAEGQRQATPEAQAVALENRGYSALKQGRLEEARRAFEGSIRVRPEGSGPYSGLAEIYLRQGTDAERALSLVEKALGNKRSSLIMRCVDGYRWAEFRANKAWALAAAGRAEEARQALGAAWKKAPKSFRAEMAMLHYRSAQVERLLGNHAKAVDHLRSARGADPNGAAGRLAAEALAQGL